MFALCGVCSDFCKTVAFNLRQPFRGVTSSSLSGWIELLCPAWPVWYSGQSGMSPEDREEKIGVDSEVWNSDSKSSYVPFRIIIFKEFKFKSV